MKKLLFLLIIISVYSCKTESDVKPAKEKTFVRYFGTENNNQAVLAQEIENGLGLLSTTEISEGVGEVKYRVKFITTDAHGNYPQEYNFPSQDMPDMPEGGIKASSFIRFKTTNGTTVNSGYLIIGDGINEGSSDIRLLELNDGESELTHKKTISPPAGQSWHGHAIMQEESSEDFLILGSIEGDPSHDMLVAKVSNDFNNIIWLTKYGAGTSKVINRLYRNNSQNVFWGGSVLNTSSNKYDVRLVRAPENSLATITGNPIGKPEFDESAMDFCEAFGGWAITGSTTESTTSNGDENIYVMKITSNSEEIFYTKLDDVAGQNDRGVSIAPTHDNGFMILGTVGISEKNNDLFIAKINASGVHLADHTYTYGGADNQEGASIRATSDGSFLVFGTTYYGNTKKLMLLKVDKNGKL